MKAMKVIKGASKLGRMFGLPTPDIPPSWVDSASEVVDGLSGGDSGYACVTEAAGLAIAGKEGEDRMTALSQFQAHQFEEFLKKNDTQDNWKTLLTRVALKDG
eukprot:COSAG01_NODE_57924_length_309_cov_0.857143_1_plen_102_part_11